VAAASVSLVVVFGSLVVVVVVLVLVLVLGGLAVLLSRLPLKVRTLVFVASTIQ